MKSFSEFKESIIDIPRRTYAPGVFDDEDTDNPKIKDSVLRIITKQFEEFESEYQETPEAKNISPTKSIEEFHITDDSTSILMNKK